MNRSFRYFGTNTGTRSCMNRRCFVLIQIHNNWRGRWNVEIDKPAISFLKCWQEFLFAFWADFRFPYRIDILDFALLLTDWFDTCYFWTERLMDAVAKLGWRVHKDPCCCHFCIDKSFIKTFVSSKRELLINDKIHKCNFKTLLSSSSNVGAFFAIFDKKKCIFEKHLKNRLKYSHLPKNV